MKTIYDEFCQNPHNFRSLATLSAQSGYGNLYHSENTTLKKHGLRNYSGNLKKNRAMKSKKCSQNVAENVNLVDSIWLKYDS